MVVAKKWILAKHFEGKPQPSNIKLQTEQLPETLKDGEILCEAVWLSVDPYMRIFPNEEGNVMVGAQVAKVLKSNNSKFPVGTHIVADLGWRTHSVVSDDSQLTKLPEMGDLSLSLALGTMGMPGMTAYLGLLERCEPKSGEVVLVNAAAGAVGNVVGQIAKLKGCKVIGFAGTEEKCAWLKELGFDHVFNYKTIKIAEALKIAAPDGVDCYYDNVGGDFTSVVLKHMKFNGRICICGCISGYNSDTPPSGPYPYLDIIFKQLSMRGIMVFSLKDRFPEVQKQMFEWIQKGLIKTRETRTEGFENMPRAFFGLFEGNNIGKAVVKA